MRTSMKVHICTCAAAARPDAPGHTIRSRALYGPILRAAFLGPDTVLELRNPIADWDQQRRLLGFSPVRRDLMPPFGGGLSLRFYPSRSRSLLLLWRLPFWRQPLSIPCARSPPPGVHAAPLARGPRL